jgi:hypothetical protein
MDSRLLPENTPHSVQITRFADRFVRAESGKAVHEECYIQHVARSSSNLAPAVSLADFGWPWWDGSNLRSCWLGNGRNLVADLLKPGLMQSHTTIVVPLDKRVIFVRSHNRSEPSCRLSEVAQTHDAIPGIQFRVGSSGSVEQWTFRSVCISGRSSV